MKPSVLELRQLARRCSNGDTAALDELNLYSDNPSPVQSEALYLLGTLYDQNEAIPRLPINLELARREKTGGGLTETELEGWVSHYLEIATGEAGTVSDAVLRLTGRPAQNVAEYLQNHPESYSHLLGR